MKLSFYIQYASLQPLSNKDKKELKKDLTKNSWDWFKKWISSLNGYKSNQNWLNIVIP